MAFAHVLCVILLVRQISMMPLNSVGDASEIVKKPVGSVGDAAVIAKNMFNPIKNAAIVSNLPLDLAEDVSETSEVSRTRTKRAVIGNKECPEGYARMWKGGSCVTCEVYMDHMNTDECPGDSSS